MEKLITAEDVKNLLNINIAEDLEFESPQYADEYLQLRTDEVIDYIGTYAWGGRKRAEQYLAIPDKRATIKRAVLKYIEELSRRNYVQPVTLYESVVRILSVGGVLYLGGY